MSIFLQTQNLSVILEAGDGILKNINLTIRDQDILILQGKSGCGKTTLLKSLAHLNVYEGQVLLHGKPPISYSIPTYRTHVLYVPQRPSLLPGTPNTFLTQLSTFKTHSAHAQERQTSNSALAASIAARAHDVSVQWGVTEELWDRPWSNLSGGEAQRIALATAVGLNRAEILLLDEPTSALDSESSLKVEEYIKQMIRDPTSPTRAVVWITHSPEQGKRVGTRFITVANGQCIEEPRTQA